MDIDSIGAAAGIAGAVSALVVAFGAWLKWGIIPVLAAYYIGRRMGVLRGRQEAAWRGAPVPAVQRRPVGGGR